MYFLYTRFVIFLLFYQRIFSLGCTSPCENGGICMGNGVCQCPAPFSGPTCGSVTLVKVVKPTRRVVIEDPNGAILEKLRRRALHPYITQIPQQVGHLLYEFELVCVGFDQDYFQMINLDYSNSINEQLAQSKKKL